MQVLSIRLPLDMLNGLSQLAHQANISRNRLITQILQYGLENCVVVSEEDGLQTR